MAASPGITPRGCASYPNRYDSPPPPIPTKCTDPCPGVADAAFEECKDWFASEDWAEQPNHCSLHEGTMPDGNSGSIVTLCIVWDMLPSGESTTNNTCEIEQMDERARDCYDGIDACVDAWSDPSDRPDECEAESNGAYEDCLTKCDMKRRWSGVYQSVAKQASI